MSSFIIDKKEFVKCAGLVYGAESKKRDPHRYFMDRVLKEFIHVYNLNVLSVNEQYNEDTVPEEGMFTEVFEEYARKGAHEWFHNRQEFRFNLIQFFSSVLYQIENEDMSRAASAWFCSCILHLFSPEKSDVEGWWGEVSC